MLSLSRSIRWRQKLAKGGSINKYVTLVEGVKDLYSSARKAEQKSTAEFLKLIGKTLVLQNFEALREFHLERPLHRDDAFHGFL